MIKPNLEDLAVLDVQKVLHICITQPIISDMSSVGFDGISIKEAVDIPKAKKEKASKNEICDLRKHLNIQNIIGTPGDLKRRCKKSIK